MSMRPRMQADQAALSAPASPGAPAAFGSPAGGDVSNSMANMSLGAPVSMSHPHGEGRNFSNTSQDKPIVRRMVASIKATLADLCNSSSKSSWTPSPEQLNSIFQQTQFTDLAGSTKRVGDLRNTVMHSVKAKQVKSSFPVSLGVNVTGVDPNTYSHLGTPYSMIVLSNTDSSAERTLQEDDPSVAHRFMKQYPGYTANNLESNGVIHGGPLGFVLVSQDHPLMAAVHDHQQSLQVGEIEPMPEGLYKLHSSLYQTILPIVKQQVTNQIHVRDMSKFSIDVSPAEYPNWQGAMDALTTDRIRSLKTARSQALANATRSGDKPEDINAHFDAEEIKLTSEVQQTTVTFDIEAEMAYSFMAN